MFKEFNRVHDKKENRACLHEYAESNYKVNPWQYKPVLVTTESVKSYIHIKT